MYIYIYNYVCIYTYKDCKRKGICICVSARRLSVVSTCSLCQARVQCTSAGDPVLPCGTLGRGLALGVPATAAVDEDGPVTGLVDRAVAVLQDTVKVKDVKGHAAVSVLWVGFCPNTSRTQAQDHSGPEALSNTHTDSGRGDQGGGDS